MQIAIKHANQLNAKKIIAIDLTIGEMRDHIESLMQKYFDYISKGTIADGAKITITRTSTTFECRRCGEIYPVNVREKESSDCPNCMSKLVELKTGTEMCIENISIC